MENSFDVVVIGGALSGASTAFMLLEENPFLKVLIVEKSSAFSRRVGEATVEISSYFLMRRLGLTGYLGENHLVKNGLRFWFYNDKTENLSHCSEIGAKYLVRVPAYQVDRAKLDEEVLQRAVQAGASLWRPANVQKIELNPGGFQRIVIKQGEKAREISARWVVDASGMAAVLARQNGWWKPNEDHPTTAVWSRWKNVGDFDAPALARKYPGWADGFFGIRNTATNHLMGPGWWAWWIPLKGGDVSIGVTFDQRLVSFPKDDSLGPRLKQFLLQHPVARELMADASPVEGDVHWRKNLPYHTTTHAGDGFVLVGDAAGFIDPFYSPGMDWIAFTTSRAVKLILSQQRGEAIEPLLQRHNTDFSRSYHRWFDAIYRDKYEYFGEYDLVRVGFLLDLGFYYLGVASQPFRRGRVGLEEPLFSTAPSVPFYHLIRFYNRRLAAIGRTRRNLESTGQSNDRRRFLFSAFTFSRLSVRHMIYSLLI